VATNPTLHRPPEEPEPPHATAAEPTDEELLFAISFPEDDPKGARAACDAFHRRHVPYLYPVCLASYRWSLGPEGVEELVQDVFMRVFQGGSATFNMPRATEPAVQSKIVRAWLGTIAQNLYKTRCRSRAGRPKPRPLIEDVPAVVQTVDPLPSAVTERVASIMRAKLKPDEVEIVATAIYWYDFKKKEFRLPPDELDALAARVGLTSEHLRVKRHRAMQKLERALEAEFGHLREGRQGGGS
jgi:DNA-directed RNA polymerase specialized sigma24 family protein